MSGLDVCAGIKADPRTASTPVHARLRGRRRAGGPQRRARPRRRRLPGRPDRAAARCSPRCARCCARRGPAATPSGSPSRLDRLSSASLRINVALNAGPAGRPPPPRAPPGCSTPRPWSLLVEDADRRRGADAPASGQRHHRGHGASAELTAALLRARATAAVVARRRRAVDLRSCSGSYDGPWTVVPGHRRGTASVGLVAVPAHAERHRRGPDAAARGWRRPPRSRSANLRVFVEEHRTALTLQRSLLPAEPAAAARPARSPRATRPPASRSRSAATSTTPSAPTTAAASW